MSNYVPPLLGGTRGHISTLATIRAREAAVALSPNDSAWNILYGAMTQSLGVCPQNFQLVYPMTSWNWPTNNLGFTSAAQYDFCATIPQWSAVGGYVSSGATFDSAYQQFLNTIVLNTSDPVLQQKIANAQNNLTQASQDYQSVYLQANTTYNSSVTGNNPSFTSWLGTPPGFTYNSQLQAAQQTVTQAQGVLNALTQQQTTPNIANALAAFANPAYQTKLSDPTLSGNPPVPGWSLSMSANQWVNQVQGSGGNAGSISFSNNSAQFDYSNTWAKGSTSASGWFWSVNASGSWQQINEFYTDSSLSCTISFEAWDTIGITPSKWYSGTTAFRNGPFSTGYTPYKGGASTAYMFGDGGIVPAFKTGMLVCYQPSITIEVSQSTYQSFYNKWEAAGGIQVGPFQIGGSAGGTKLNWSQSGSGMKMTTVSTSTVPLIFGVNVAIQPQ